jgi:hypothetical protein
VVLLAVLVGRIVGMLVSQQSETNIDRRFDALAQLIRGQEQRGQEQRDSAGADPTVETDDSSQIDPPQRDRWASVPEPALGRLRLGPEVPPGDRPVRVQGGAMDATSGSSAS